MKCECCDREFEAKRSTARYCCAGCRIKASRGVSVTDSVTKEVSVTNIAPKSVTLKMAGESIKVDLGKPYSTDPDCRFSLNYDLSEEGFKRRNKNWMDYKESTREMIRKGAKIRAKELIERITAATTARMNVLKTVALDA